VNRITESLNTLREIEWIPSKGGALIRATEVLIPTQNNIDLVGENYTLFPAQWDAPFEGNQLERARDDLGMRDVPESGTILGLICGSFMAEGGDDEPSPNLCEELMQRIPGERPSDSPKDFWIEYGPHEENDIDIGQFNYQLANGNIILNQEGNRAWVVDNQYVELLRSAFPDKTVSSVDDLRDRNHIDLFEDLGVFNLWPPLYSEVLLEIGGLGEGDDEKLRSLWLLLEQIDVPSNVEKIEEERTAGRVPQNNTIRIPYSQNLVHPNPEKVVLLSNDEQERNETVIGDYLLLLPSEERKKWLSTLGSNELGGPGVVGEILDSCIEQFREDDEALNSIMWLIGRTIGECNNVLVWSGDTLEITRLNEPGEHPQVIHQGRWHWDLFRKSLPFIFQPEEENREYNLAVNSIQDGVAVQYDVLARTEVRPPEDDDWAAHTDLERCLMQIIRALTIVEPETFIQGRINDIEIVCKRGSSGLPRWIVINWDEHEHEKFLEDENEPHGSAVDENSVTMYINEDSFYSNPWTVSSELVEALLKCTVLRDFKQRVINDNAFLKVIKRYVLRLLSTEPDDWGLLDEPLGRLGEHEWENFKNLFESQSYADLRSQMKNDYDGCQICQWTTAFNTEGEFSEALVNIIQQSSHYKGRTTEYRTQGRHMWLCPNHGYLLSRGLIRFEFMEDLFYSAQDNIPLPNHEEYELHNYEHRELAIEQLLDMRNNLQENDIVLWVYERVEGRNEPEWRHRTGWDEDAGEERGPALFRHKREHGKDLISAMIDWIRGHED